MAYFLDAELNALTLAEQARPAMRRASSPSQPSTAARGARSNRYAAPCAACGKTVPANTGTLNQRNGKWIVNHAVAC